MRDSLSVRYLLTRSFTRVVAHLRSDQILRLRAVRSFKVDDDGASSPLRYLNCATNKVFNIGVDYTSLLHGRFDKKATADLIREEEAEDLCVHEIHVLLPEDAGSLVAREANKITGKRTGRSERKWVLMLDEHPTRRDRGANAYTVEVEDFREAWERKIGFEPASLDFTMVLPLENWKEIMRAPRLSKEYKESMRSWEESRTPKLMKAAILGAFPAYMTKAREYRLTDRASWELTGVFA